MLKFLAGIVFTVLMIPVFVFLYVKMGYVPVATDAPAIPFERTLAHMGLNARLTKKHRKMLRFRPRKTIY